MATDSINEYLATAKKATLQAAGGAEALMAAVHQRWSVKTGADPMPAALRRTVEDWFRVWLRCVIVPGCGLVVQVSCEMGEAPARSVIA
jgi:hypothetical protein